MNELQRNRINLINGYSLEAIAIAVLLFFGYDTAISPFINAVRLKMAVVALLVFVLIIGRPFNGHLNRNIAYTALIILSMFSAYVKTNSISGFNGCFNVLSWVLCAFFAQFLLLEKYEIKLVLLAVKYASIISSVILLSQNRWFSSQYEYDLLFLTMNRNGVIVFTTTGLAIMLIQVLLCKSHWLNHIYLAIVGLAAVQANSRNIFLTVIVVVGSIMVYYLKSANDEKKARKAISILLILVILISIWFVAIPNDYKDRLWNSDSYSLGNSSRIDLWEQAISMTKDPILGMGPNYCQNNLYHKAGEHLYGSHNFLVDTYTNSGIIVALTMAYIFFSYFKRDWLLYAFFITPIMEMMFESGRNFSTWGGLIILGLILNRTLLDNMTFSEEIIDILESNGNENEREYSY